MNRYIKLRRRLYDSDVDDDELRRGLFEEEEEEE